MLESYDVADIGGEASSSAFNGVEFALLDSAITSCGRYPGGRSWPAARCQRLLAIGRPPGVPPSERFWRRPRVWLLLGERCPRRLGGSPVGTVAALSPWLRVNPNQLVPPAASFHHSGKFRLGRDGGAGVCIFKKAREGLFTEYL